MKETQLQKYKISLIEQIDLEISRLKNNNYLQKIYFSQKITKQKISGFENLKKQLEKINCDDFNNTEEGFIKQKNLCEKFIEEIRKFEKIHNSYEHRGIVKRLIGRTTKIFTNLFIDQKVIADSLISILTESNSRTNMRGYCCGFSMHKLMSEIKLEKIYKQKIENSKPFNNP